MEKPVQRPLIAISGSSTDRVLCEVNRHSAAERAKALVEAAGGHAVIIDHRNPNASKPSEFDGFLLMGNYYDIDPTRYGQAPAPTAAVETNRRAYPTSAEYEVGTRRMKFEEAAIKHAVANKLPLVGICGGMQRINVALGGTLDQSQKEHLQAEEVHNHATPTHLIRIEKGSALEALAKPGPSGNIIAPVAMRDGKNAATIDEVNSFHNNTIGAPGKGLRISAVAEDGHHEAMESTEDGQYIRGYQWHPESLPSMPLSQAIFRELVEKVRDRHTERPGAGPLSDKAGLIPTDGRNR